MINLFRLATPSEKPTFSDSHHRMERKNIFLIVKIFFQWIIKINSISDMIEGSMASEEIDPRPHKY